MPELLRAIDDLAPQRRAELFVCLRAPEQKAVLAAARPELMAPILYEADSASLRAVLLDIDIAAVLPALRLVPPDGVADLLLHLPETRAKALLDAAGPAVREEVEPLLQFDPASAGGLMTTRILSVPDAVTVGRALELLRKSRGSDPASYVYVVDAAGRLVGTVPLRTLVLAEPRSELRPLVKTDIVKVRTSAPQEEVVRLFSERRFVSLPVVDDKERLVGIVTSEAAAAAMRRGEEEVARELTGADARERWKETLVAARGRVPWITVTIVGGLACAAIGALFKRVLQEVVVIGLFVPIVLGLAESVAAQTMSVVLGAIAGGDARARGLSFAAKEVAIGLLVGLYAGVAVSLTSWFWHGNARIGVVIGAACVASIGWAALLGAAVPAAMARRRMNATFASGPIALVLTDLSTLAVYLGSATVALL
jgi:magnesium transporter